MMVEVSLIFIYIGLCILYRHLLDKPPVSCDLDRPWWWWWRWPLYHFGGRFTERQKKEAQGRTRHVDHWICHLQGMTKWPQYIMTGFWFIICKGTFVLIDLHPQIPPLFLNKCDFIRTVIDKIISRYSSNLCKVICWCINTPMKTRAVTEICSKNDWPEHKNPKSNWKLCDPTRPDLKKFWNHDSPD